MLVAMAILNILCFMVDIMLLYSTECVRSWKPDFLVPPLRLGPGYVYVKFDLNLHSFAITFGRSAIGLVKKAAPSRVCPKSRLNILKCVVLLLFYHLKMWWKFLE